MTLEQWILYLNKKTGFDIIYKEEEFEPCSPKDEPNYYEN
jgi:hypothetical protein